MNLKGKKLPILASATLAFCIFMLLYFQGKSGDNEVLFAHRSEAFNDGIRQYLVTRRSFMEREGYFPHDAYYFDEILKLLRPGVDELRGEEKGIIEARISILENLKPLVVNYENGLQSNAQIDLSEILHSLDKDQLVEKRESLENLLQIQHELVEFEKSLNWSYARNMEEKKVDGWKIERELSYAGLSFFGDLRSHWRKMMRAKRRSIGLQLSILEILENDWGLWSADPETGEIVFAKEDDSSREYNKLEEQLVDFEKQEVTLFKELRFLY